MPVGVCPDGMIVSESTLAFAPAKAHLSEAGGGSPRRCPGRVSGTFPALGRGEPNCRATRRFPPDRPRHAGSPSETRGSQRKQGCLDGCRATGTYSEVTSFSDLGLAAPLLRALEEAGYATPTPIQGQAIPTVLEGRDLLGIAQTGTGKTAAFALPILHRLAAKGGRPPPRRLPRPGAEPDARAVLADRRQLPRLRQAPRPVGRGGVRRRPARPAAPGARGRRRRARRHAGPPAGPHGRRHRPPRPGRGAGARRGRPDAGQGLPARHPQDRPGPATAAADAVLLGHHAGGDRPPRRRSAARSRAGGGDAGRHHGRAGDAAGAARGAGRQARPAGQAAARRGRRARAGLRPHQARRRPGGEATRPGRSRGQRHPRQQEPEPARARPAGVPDRPGADPGGDRHRRPRHRRGRT